MNNEMELISQLNEVSEVCSTIPPTDEPSLTLECPPTDAAASTTPAKPVPLTARDGTPLTAQQKFVFKQLAMTKGHDEHGPVPECTIQNFLLIFELDEVFSGVHYNKISRRPELHASKGVREWESADDSWSQGYIENTYRLYHPTKWGDALVQFQRERAYNPLEQKLECVEWDGVPRCKTFLNKWLKAEDSEYSQEVSRLIFAGGIHRLYEPGCKFDCVPVLIGKQGSGKSTLCHWLALEDKFYNSLITVDGQKGSEGLHGVWICELEELMAVLSTSDHSNRAEKVKAFITRQDEYYREPYAKRSENHPRSCIFIGTTNKDQFLTDKTGGRRWYPVKVNSTARDLYDNEAECRNDILQAWAEMLDAYKKELPLASLTTDKVLEEEVARQQQDAAEEDWRIGIVDNYVVGRDRVCILQIWEEAITQHGSQYDKLKRKDSNDIADILVHQLGWVRGGTVDFGEPYGKQKSYHRAA